MGYTCKHLDRKPDGRPGHRWEGIMMVLKETGCGLE